MMPLVGNEGGDRGRADVPADGLGHSLVSGEDLSTGVPISQEPGGLDTSASPAPVAEPARLTRPCAFDRRELVDPRPNRLFCDVSCRAHYHRAWEENTRRSTSKARKPFKTVRKPHRRATKTESGTRIYLVPKEIKAAAKDLKPTSPESKRVLEKVKAAGKRVQSRAAA